MGRTYAAVFWLIVLMAVPVFADTSNSGSAAEFTDFALPEFNRKSGQLEYILYGKKATNLGANVTLIKAIVDLVRKDVGNINNIISLANTKPYPLHTKQKDVRKFWKNKQHSQALIFSDHAVYDKNLRMLKSDTPVYLRSPELAIDGVGFDADQERKFIHVRQKVRIVLYSDTRRKNMSRNNTKKEK